MNVSRSLRCFLLCGALAVPVHAQQVEFDLADTLKVGETEVDYRLDLAMNVVSPTRLGFEALLDLRDLQERLPGLMVGEPVSDGCGSRTDLTEFAIEAEGDVVALTGKLDTQFFKCNRTSETNFSRGAPTDRWNLGFKAAASAKLKDKCITFELVELAVEPLQAGGERAGLLEDLEAIRAILLEVAGRYLEERPFCPEFPEELASLDPVYETGGPREIEDGGLGLHIHGSIDVSTTTILDILKVLQRENVIPGPP